MLTIINLYLGKIINDILADLAQLVELPPCKRRVIGSTPIVGSINYLYKNNILSLLLNIYHYFIVYPVSLDTSFVNMNYFKLIILLNVILLSGCAHQIKFVEFSTGIYVYGTIDKSNRTIKVTLPNGEALEGKYTKNSGAKFSIGATVGKGRSSSIWGVSPRLGIGGKKQIYSIITSHSSKLIMEIIADVSWPSGSGFGEARTNDGRVFKVIF